MITRYSFIPLSIESVFAVAVVQWELDNPDARPIIAGCYGTLVGEPNETVHHIGAHVALRDTRQLPDNSWQSLKGFCLVADNNQLPDDKWAQITALGGTVYQDADTFLQFQSTL